MSVKTPAGGGTEDSFGASGAGGGDPTDSRGSINGRIFRDVESVYRCAAQFKSAADRWRSFANGIVDFATFAPLKRGQADESWNAYAPKYFKASSDFVNFCSKTADALDSSADALRALALASQRTEEGNTEIARHATSYKAVPDSTQSTGVEPLARRLLRPDESAGNTSKRR